MAEDRLKIPKEVLVLQKVEVVVDCDMEKLYGPIQGAIEYLQEIASQYPNTDISLEEEWNGYEDMHMQFVYHREETESEQVERIAEWKRKRKQELDQQAKINNKNQIEREIQRLRTKLTKMGDM